MRWLSRSLWLLAWSGWAWLGFGLYRELPRDLGQPLSVIPFDHKERRIVGFIGDSNRIAITVHAGPRSPLIEVYDATTGMIVYSKPGAETGSYLSPRSHDQARTSLFAKELLDSKGVRAIGIHRFDLETGEWTRLSKNPAGYAVVHPTKPWIAFVETEEITTGNRDARVVLVDWKTRKEKVVRELVGEHTLNGGMFFLDGPDRLALSMGPRIRMFNDPPTGFVEVWKLKDHPTLENRIEDLMPGPLPSASPNGRVAFSVPGHIGVVDVYDFNAANLVFTNVSWHERPEPSRDNGDFFARPVLSRTTRHVLGGVPPTLWDVETGSVLWQGRGMVIKDEYSSVFLVFEIWSEYWKKWFPKVNYATKALRDLESGRLLFRTTGYGNLIPNDWNASGTLALRAGGVYRLPPPANWPLLALCQTILALPLVLLWAGLRWRRRGRLLRMLAAPSSA